MVDSSAWIEAVRATGSAVDLTLRRLIRSRAPLAATEVVVMELLAGVLSETGEKSVRRLLAGLPVLPLQGIADFERAARMFRVCRAAGEQLRETIDCLVAVPVIRAEAALLHADRDFDVLARHTPLKIEPLLA